MFCLYVLGLAGHTFNHPIVFYLAYLRISYHVFVFCGRNSLILFAPFLISSIFERSTCMFHSDLTHFFSSKLRADLKFAFLFKIPRTFIRPWCLIPYAFLSEFHPLCPQTPRKLNLFPKSKPCPVVPPNVPPTMTGSRRRPALLRGPIRKYLMLHVCVQRSSGNADFISRNEKQRKNCMNK